MTNSKTSNLLSGSAFGLTAAGRVLIYAVAVAACLSLNVWYSLVTAVLCFIVSAFYKQNNILCPHPFFLVPLTFVAVGLGVSYLPLTVILAGAVFALLAIPKGKVEFPDAVKLGASIGLAFGVTALATTYYFGIGATGSTVWEILKNYRYLGFHANWRGVFYGTITLFFMITYPFKCKKLSKYVPAETLSVALPLVLNLILNPDKDTTPITELGNLSKISALENVSDFLPIINTGSVNFETILTVLMASLSIVMITYMFCDNGRKNILPASQTAASGVFGGFPSAPEEILRYTPMSAVVAVVCSAVIVIFCPGVIGRIPLHSLAVVLIVSAWKRVKFSEIGRTVKTEKFTGVFIIALSALVFVFVDIFKALVVCLCLGTLFGRRKKA